MEQLRQTIRRKYKPKEVTVEELADNIFDNMVYELSENHTDYFAIPDDPLADTLSYVRFCGGFKWFDRKAPELEEM